MCIRDSGGHTSATGIFLGLYARDTTLGGWWDPSGGGVGLGRCNYMSCAGGVGAPEANPAHSYWGDFAGIFHNRSENSFGQITDGSSNTIAFMEQGSNTEVAGTMTDYSWICDGMPSAWGIYVGRAGGWFQPKSQHTGNLIIIALGDGSGHSVTASIENAIFNNLAGRADGRIVGIEDI